MKRTLGLFALMMLLVLPLTGLLAGLAFAAYPGETEPFTSSLGNAMALVFLYGTPPGMLLVLLHAALLRRSAGTTPPTMKQSVLIACVLGGVVGVGLTQVLAWKLSVVFLGVFAGLVYGFLASWVGRRWALISSGD